MTDRDFNAMNEQEFDKLLSEELSALPPSGDLVKEITPWRHAVNRILAGLAMNALTLNFLWLNYLLPLIGTVMLFLGFRTLRRENGWFRLGWILSIPYLVLRLFFSVLNATIWNQTFYDHWSPILSPIGVGLILITVFSLWGGFRAVQKKAGLPPHAGSAIALLVWYLLLIGLGLLQYSGLILGLLFFALYGLIIYYLYLLSAELDEAGYTIRPAPIRVSDSVVKQICLAVIIVGFLLGYLVFNHYPMDWAPVNSTEQAGLEDIRAHLLELGFPEQVLDDLTAEDLSACEGALRVVVDVTDEPVNDGRKVTYGNGTHWEYPVKELHITGIAVELPGEREHWKFFHHFLWQVAPDPDFYGTEAIQIWPSAREGLGWMVDGQFSGQVLYDRDGQSYASPYHYAGNITYQKSFLLRGVETASDYYLTFSFPRQGERQRGYVSYDILETRDGSICDSWFNYVHQRSWLQYPVQTAMDHRITSSFFSGNRLFFTVQDALQFYPTKDNINLY